MILDAAAIVAGYPFVARRHGRVALCDPSAVAACCLRAEELAGGDPTLEPAAVFLAFAEKRRAFPFAWKLMAQVLARRQASLNSLSLAVRGAELDALCIEVLYRRADWDHIRAFFAERSSPAPP